MTRPRLAEEQVFGNGQVAAIGQLLMNRRDAGVDRVMW